MRILDALRDGARSTYPIASVSDYAAALDAFGGGFDLGSPIQQTMSGQKAEPIPADFVGLAQAAYKRNGVVFACMLVRQQVFSSVRFAYQRLNSAKPSELFGTTDLAVLEEPWTGGTTQDMLVRTIQDADLAGNSYWTLSGPELVRLRPDWVQIILEPRTVAALPKDGKPMTGTLGWRRLGYVYTEGGPTGNGEPILLRPAEVAHFAPIPDPEATYRGMSWLTPIVREIQADGLMSRHKLKFFEHAATPNMVIRHKEGTTPESIRKLARLLEENNSGLENAYRNLHIGNGADVTVVGANLRQLEFRTTQGHGETRIAAAAGVPPVIVGLSEGLEAATYCGAADAPVWTTRGIVRLDEVIEGDAVWSYVAGHLEARKVTWQHLTGTKPVYTVRTKNRTIRFTDNHPVLVRVAGDLRGNRPYLEWRRVDQLRVGDRVVQAQRLPDQDGRSLPNGTPATAEVLQWLGAYTGDGCLSGDEAVRMCIPIQDRVRDHYAALAGRLFRKQTSWAAPGRRAGDGLTEQMVRLRAEGLTYRQIVEQMQLSLHPMSVRDRIRTATREYVPGTAPVEVRPIRNGFTFHSRRAVAWHHLMGVTGYATTKRVPGWVFELGENLRLAYLAGIVDTDGSVGPDGRLTIQFAGQQLVSDVRMLLIGCGIACSNIAQVHFDAKVLPNPGRHKSYTAWRFVASSAVEVARIPFADKLYRQRVEAHQHRHRPGGGDATKAGLGDGLGFYAIRSIEIGDPEPVYDIEVDGGHSFLVDGVVVHNSNYGQARRRLADGTAHPLWGNAAGSFATLVKRQGPGTRLWYDPRNVPFLREDEKDAATIQETQARTIRTLVDGGYTPESAQKAVLSNDFGLLQHTGYFSVQLRPAGQMDQPNGGQA